MLFRTIKLKDYKKLILFWKAHYFVRGIDSLNYFKLFLEKNPNLSILVENNGEIIGTVLGSFDGRRGYIQKLVVHKDYRRKGVGKRLVKEILKRFMALGVLYIPINCEEENVPFYEKCGFKKTKQVPMNMNL